MTSFENNFKSTFHHAYYLAAMMVGLLATVFNPRIAQAQDTQKVFVMEIRKEIDPRMTRYVELALEEAKEVNADIILVDMDTYGGAVNDADKIRTLFLDETKPTYVFINKNAASAGALISIACDSIYMAPGSNIGAATVVTGDGTPAPDKFQSYMRSMMRSTAEAKGRDPKIAEGMVGIGDSLNQPSKVITFSTQEAIENGFCEGKASSIAEVLKLAGVEDYERIDFSLGTIENIISVFLNPFLRGILILVIIGGLYFELQTPGVGFPILASVTAMLLYFVPSYLHGLANNLELILFIIGVILIMLELFVIPGFGIPGVTGIVLILASLVFAMLDNDNLDFTFVDPDAIAQAIVVVIVGLAGGFIIIFFGGAKFIDSPYFKRIALQETMNSVEGYTTNLNKATLVGKTGIAHTVLRPSGKVIIDGLVHDAYSRGEFIEKGQEIEVEEQMGNYLKVKIKG
ncbi:NfeD family protein [Cytophagaceae bacterium ABcell3]|nr:NfeD family protein [Cytophagaceae bacterium ABcell3]